MNASIDSSPATKTTQPVEFELFRKTVLGICATARTTYQYLLKLLYISVVTGVVIAGTAYVWIAQWGTLLLIVASFAFAPTVLILFLRTKLSRVLTLPDHLDKFSTFATDIALTIKTSGIAGTLKEFVAKEAASPMARVKRLIQVAPALLKIKNQLSQSMQPELFFTLAAVSNPAFGGLVVFSLVLTVLWSILAVLCAISWLFLG